MPKKMILKFAFLIFTFILFSDYTAQLQRHQAVSSYIYNFAKNVQWKNESDIQSFNFLVIGDDKQIISELRTLAGSKTLRGKPITISTGETSSNIRDAHLIFITKDAQSRHIEVFDKIEGKNKLLVSDGYKDKQLIMINFIEKKTGGLHFEINKANIINQNIRILEDMILLGGTEVDVADLYKQGQQSLRDLQKEHKALESKSQVLESELKKLEKVIIEKSVEIHAQKDSLNNQRKMINEQQKILDEKSLELKESVTELEKQLAKIKEQEEIFNRKSLELEKQRTDLEKGNAVLGELKNQIKEQRLEINKQSEILATQGKKIQSQQSYLYLMLVIILLAILLAGAIYKGYQSKKLLSEQLEQKVHERTVELKHSNEQLVKELSERTKAEEALKDSERHYRYLFDQNPVPMLVYELSSLRLLAVNDAFAANYGYTKEESVSLVLHDLYPQSEKEAIERLTKTLAGHAYVGEWHHVKKDGTLIVIEARSHEFQYEGKASRIAVINDVTEKKAAEEELHKYKAQLEEKVKERTVELEIAKDRAESADRLKSAFLATMSHELRTPLNSIIGFTGILLKGIAGPLNNEQLKQLTMAKGSAQHLLELINDVLDISKIEAGQLVVSLSDFDLITTLSKVVSTVQPLAAKRNLDLIFNSEAESCDIHSDERRIGQILLNLINNAIKFTDNGYVKVDFAIKDRFAEISVTDSGIGIKEEDLDKLFKPFSQVDTGLSRNREGTGLGLSITARLIEKLNGSISVKSVYGEGSVFTVRLPLS